ncbi:MAG: EsaB/YukD family protein [Pasteurella sp.]|nr:EsaB/YukD family protein [Pasteurella sp.]
MSDLDLTILHPTDGSNMQVELPDDMTAGEVIENLIANEFVEPTDDGYALNVKGGATLDKNATLGSAGVTSGNTLVVAPLTDAGA